MSFTQTFLVQCLLFIPLPYILFAAFKSRRVMPLAVLQVLVGVVMGPSLFGRLYPELFAEIFRPDMVLPLRGIALIAVLLFAFITGLHLDLTRLRGRAAALGMVAGASLVVPFVAGLGCGIWIVSRDTLASAHPVVFIFAIGICTSVTAMPVLGAILREMDLLSHHIGQLALSLAAMNDAALWVMLTLLLAVMGSPGSAPALLLLLPVYFGGHVLDHAPAARSRRHPLDDARRLEQLRAGNHRWCGRRLCSCGTGDRTRIHPRRVHRWGSDTRGPAARYARPDRDCDDDIANAVFLHAHRLANLHRSHFA
jgi:hypothetical protein